MVTGGQRRVVGPLAIDIVTAGGVRRDEAKLAAHPKPSNAKLRGVKRTPPLPLLLQTAVAMNRWNRWVRVCLFLYGNVLS